MHGREEAPAIVPGPPLGWWVCIRREGLPRVYQPGAVPALCGLATGDHGQLEPRSIACVPRIVRGHYNRVVVGPVLTELLLE